LHGYAGKPSRQAAEVATLSRKEVAEPLMFSVPDVLVVSMLALLLFGPDRLPKLMRQAGRFMREVQNTSHSFIAEMERAADTSDSPMPPAPPRAIENEPERQSDPPDSTGEREAEDRGPR
jgi:TatA/E family protein of Tat protein translocase